jgi:2-methylfumaryl-CoA hydratase
LTSVSEVIGVKENSSGKTGTVYVRTTGTNQHGQMVLSYVRWVMVNKRDAASPAPEAQVPDLPKAVDASALGKAVPSARYGRMGCCAVRFRFCLGRFRDWRAYRPC